MDSKIRVGFITPCLVHGGVDKHLEYLIKYSSRVQWSGIVLNNNGIYHKDVIKKLSKHMPIYYSNVKNNDSVVGMQKIDENLIIQKLAQDCDVIYTWSKIDGAVISTINIPIVYALHSSGEWASSSVREIAKYCTEFIGVSEQCRKALPPDYQDKMHIINNGIDLPNVEPIHSRETIRKSWNIKPNQKAIGFVGRWSHEKNPLIVAQAVADLGENAHMVYCIPNHDDEDVVSIEIKKHVAKITNNNVSWIQSDSMIDVYNALDCLVIPSHEEGGPIVAIEAFYCRCPVVATPVGQLIDYKNKNAYIEVPINPTKEVIAQAIKQSMSFDNISNITNAHNIAKNMNAKDMVEKWESVFAQAKTKKNKIVNSNPIKKKIKHTGSPLVSVILVARNQEDFIEEAIESILAQTFTDYEIICISDGSTDTTEAIMRKYPQIKTYAYRHSLGSSFRRNIGVQLAQGKYLASHDGDDIDLPHRLEAQIDFMESHDDIFCIGSQAINIDKYGKEGKISIYPPENHEAILECFQKGDINPMIHPSTTLRKQQLIDIGGYTLNPKYCLIEDFDLWTRAILNGYRFHNLPYPTIKYRRTNKSQTNMYSKEMKNAHDERWNMFKKNENPISDYFF